MNGAYDASNFGIAASHDVMRGGGGALAPLNNPAYTDTRDIVAGYVKIGPAKLGAGWIRRNLAAAEHLQADIVFAGGTYYATPYFALDLQGVRYLQRRENGEGGTNAMNRRAGPARSAIRAMSSSRSPSCAGTSVTTARS